MKKALLVLLGMLLGFAISQGVQSFLHAVEAGKERRFGADVRAAMRQLEDYRQAHTNYPVACDAEALTAQLGPRNFITQIGEPSFHYCSDGQQYLLAFTPFGTRSYWSAYGAPLLAANNELIAAPNAVLPADPAVGGNP